MSTVRKLLLSTVALALVTVVGLGLSAPTWAQGPRVGYQGPRVSGFVARPTPYYQLYTAYADAYAASVGIVGFLVSAAGPNWTINECYDAAYGAVKRQVPLDSHSLAAASWPVGYTVLDGAGDWCTLRTAVGDGGTQEDIYWEADGAAAIKWLQCPLDDMPVGGADASPPGFAATCHSSAVGGLVAIVAGNARYSTIADASHVKLMIDTAGSYNWIYIGEADGCLSTDTRCYVFWDLPTGSLLYGGSYLNRLATDGLTNLILGFPSQPTQSATAGIANPGGAAANGGAAGWAVQGEIVFEDAGFQAASGVLRGVGWYRRDAGNLVQTADKTLLGFCVNATATASCIWWRWDGVTAYPGAAAWAPYGGGMRMVPRAQIQAPGW